MKIPAGFLFSAVRAGLKKWNKLDLGLVYAPDFLEGAYFFTGNKVKAAPVILGINKIKKNKGRIKALIVNSGNANCFTGKEGLRDCEAVCRKTARSLNLNSKYVLASSTGIIGRKLPVEKIFKALPGLVSSLKKDIRPFARAILTTDTRMKISGKETKLGKIIGVAKGAGMIYPQLKSATMLVFIFTDINISQSLLRRVCSGIIEKSFNSISVDGCTSTNDSVFILTSKKSGGCPIGSSGALKIFSKALEAVCLDLAKKIIKDAEGATRFVKITLKGAGSALQAKQGVFSLANSVLLKTALYGANPNWGRIIQALGQAGIEVKENTLIKSSSLKNKEIDILIDLKQGRFTQTVYTSDLSPEYVKINAGYN